ncbi:MAG: AmmeMemoRadiSam system protein B [Deltaproteobacteria bacterium]|nr:AmmeMemoRadiSam system protein B [Deltaproteobacteria bacterium]
MKASAWGAAVVVLACTRAGPVSPDAAAAPARRVVRAPTVAGTFYPAEPDRLRAAAADFLASSSRVIGAPARVVLVPHAGYVYSGRVAAAALRQVEPGFERVVVIAANHNGAADFAGVSVDTATHYAWPGGEVRVSPSAAALVGKGPFVDVPAAHTMHMVEVALPLLQVHNGRPFELIPLIVGRLARRDTAVLAAALRTLATPGTLFVFSVDLSHYHPYDDAVARDRACLDALVRMNADDVAHCDTDGTHVLLVMTELAALLELTPRLITYANSGDVSGDRTRVVGYGAVAYEDVFELGSDEQAALLTVARRAVEEKVRAGTDLVVPGALAARYPRLGRPRGAFVTLKQRGQLRGCIGSLVAAGPLVDVVARNAINAAVNDRRFPPVGKDELGGVDLSISVLEEPRPLVLPPGETVPALLQRTRPGLIIELGERRSTFLPEVWEDMPAAGDFLAQLCRKQGSPEACWNDPGARLSTYRAQHFAENRAGH